MDKTSVDWGKEQLQMEIDSGAMDSGKLFARREQWGSGSTTSLLSPLQWHFASALCFCLFSFCRGPFRLVVVLRWRLLYYAVTLDGRYVVNPNRTRCLDNKVYRIILVRVQYYD